ncbi:MAG: hypothetical protein IPH75_09975 [bacterium]|nr:hypothetical protein [bacterium]
MRKLLLLTLLLLMVGSTIWSQTPNKVSEEELNKFFKNYPYVLYKTKIFNAESEFAWPDGFKRMPDSKMTKYQAWVSRMPLWHSLKGVATLGQGLAFEADEISRCVMLPWRTSKFFDYVIPMQIQLEWLLKEQRADRWQILPKAGDTMSYARWLNSTPIYDSRMRLILKPSEVRMPDSLEYNRFFNLVADNSNYLSLETNSDSVSEADLRPGDMLIARTEIGTTGRVYVILTILQNDQGDKRYLIATGGNPPCDFYIPLFHDNQNDPWLTLDELKGLPPQEFSYKGFYRLRMPK